MKDITIIFLTVNRVPKKWAEYQKGILLEAADGAPVITIARKRLDWGSINLVQEGAINADQIYRQMLRGAKLAKTPYVALAEDDMLYTKEHFYFFRPKSDEFAYNMSSWAIFTWEDRPRFGWKHRVVNSGFIGPTELTIRALEERYEKYPEGTPEDKTGELGRENIEKRLGLPHYKSVEFYSFDPIVKFNHDFSIDPLEKSHRKRMAALRAYEIPVWGKASELVKRFV